MRLVSVFFVDAGDLDREPQHRARRQQDSDTRQQRQDPDDGQLVKIITKKQSAILIEKRAEREEHFCNKKKDRRCLSHCGQECVPPHRRRRQDAPPVDWFWISFKKALCFCPIVKQKCALFLCYFNLFLLPVLEYYGHLIFWTPAI